MSDDKFVLKSFAKINWHLRVIGKRPDGFHELCTVFQTISLHDEISFSQSEELTLTCNNEKIPTDETNLIFKASNLLKDNFKIKNGAKIHLNKKIPSPGGLGGGSSNAAVALFGLTRLWKVKTSFEELSKLGAVLGSDVPFFFQGGTAIGTGRGTEIFPVKNLDEKHLLIVTPKVDISTAEAFDLLNADDLTNIDSKSILKICRQEAKAVLSRQNSFFNDFEKTVFKIAPEIERVKNKLLRLGAKSSLMSGSGASVFAVFNGKKELLDVFDRLRKETDWQVFKAETVSRKEFSQNLNIRETLG